MKLGRRSWMFQNNPVIIATGTVGGPMEAEGNIKDDFDKLYDDLYVGKDSFEKAQQQFMEDAVKIAREKAKLAENQIDFFISGDLINQITPTTFAAEKMGFPFIGISSACATTTESLALAAFILNYDGANYIVSGTASHHAATERQFRYPTEYGGQKPPTAQWTVTGAGCAILARNGDGPVVTTATIGKVVDLKLSDPFNMGGAMAPAAVDTIVQHLHDRKVDASYYDLIITGDLGKVGQAASYELLREKGVQLEKSKYQDCGLKVYTKEQPVQAGGSGTACSAVVTYGHFLKKLREGKLNRILLVATGSLHSAMTIQQKQTIPCIAHAVSIETKEMLQ